MIAALITLVALLTQMEPGSIEGRVVDSRSGEPLSRAVVELRPEGESAGSTITTLADGTFAFRKTLPGRYKLVVARAGYVTVEYKPILSVAPAQQITDIRFALTPTGTIYGRIVDRSGQPLANATVRALKVAYSDGHRSFKTEQTAITNDLGEYRLFWLAPGSYFVSALPYGAGEHLALLTTGRDPGNESLGVGIGFRGAPGLEGIRSIQMAVPNRAYVTTYYPGTTDRERAAVIDVRPDAKIGNVNITLFPVDTHHIRGIIMNSITRQPASQAQLRRARASALDVCASRSMDRENCSFESVDYDKGTFDIGPVTPGRYILYAMDNDLVAQTVVEVGETDVDNVILTLQPGITVTGAVVPPMAGVEVTLSPGPPVPGRGTLSGSSLLDGAFSVRGLTPGEYTVTVSGLKGSYVRSITSAGVDVLNQGLRITGSSDAPIQVDLGTDVSTAEGRILRSDGAPAAEATVALVPDVSRRNRKDLYRTAQTDASGQFRLNDIAPGEYKILAWQDVETGAWLDPIFLNTYEDRGQAIQVDRGSEHRVDIRVIPAAF